MDFTYPSRMNFLNRQGNFNFVDLIMGKEVSSFLEIV